MNTSADPTTKPLRILSYNTHVCIRATRSSERLKNLWKHVLPSRCKMDNLRAISCLLRQFDVVGLQESDAGSLRSYFKNHTKFLAHHGGFDHWAEQVNRDLVFARHSIGFLSRYRILSISRHQLPSKIPGRGLMVVHLDVGGEPIAFAVAHLSLGSRDRIRQALAIGDIIHDLDCRAILMGDFNCTSQSDELWAISARTGLKPAIRNMPTYPSWNPRRDIDHILVSEGISISKARTIDFPMSDHLPLAIEAVVRRSTDHAAHALCKAA